MIELIVEPRVMKTWEQFLRENLAYSIALDGYVSGAPKDDPSGPRSNLNHHEDVNRLFTRSTCAQAYMAIRQGLFEAFKENGKPKAFIYANDPDQDTSTAVTILEDHQKILVLRGEELSRLEDLVEKEDKLDTTSGTWPLNPYSNIMKSIGWIYEPYTAARASNKLFTMDSEEMKNVINDISQRIWDYVLGKCKRITPDTRYNIIYSSNDWKMIEEVGQQARTQLIWDGIKAFVVVRIRPDGNYTYTYCRIAPYIPFMSGDFYDKLNEIEGIPLDSTDKHGGGDLVGGSPKIKGSKISQEDLIKIIEEDIEEIKSKTI